MDDSTFSLGDGRADSQKAEYYDHVPSLFFENAGGNKTVCWQLIHMICRASFTPQFKKKISQN